MTIGMDKAHHMLNKNKILIYLKITLSLASQNEEFNPHITQFCCSLKGGNSQVSQAPGLIY